jgi:hypothetical protein
MPGWLNETVLIAFFTVVFLVFYAIAYSILRGLVDNYHRYAQKADLQWTGPRREQRRRNVSLIWLLVFSVVTAWLVVEFLILPF